MNNTPAASCNAPTATSCSGFHLFPAKPLITSRKPARHGTPSCRPSKKLLNLNRALVSLLPIIQADPRGYYRQKILAKIFRFCCNPSRLILLKAVMNDIALQILREIYQIFLPHGGALPGSPAFGAATGKIRLPCGRSSYACRLCPDLLINHGRI